SSAGAVGMLTAPRAQAGPARRMAVTGAAVEFVATRRLNHDAGIAAETFQRGKAGKLLRTARVLTGAGVAAALFAGRGTVPTLAAGACLSAAAAVTRYGVFEAGMASARDPRYTVEPQRQRMNRHE